MQINHQPNPFSTDLTISVYPRGAVPITASSGNVANAAATATIPAMSGKTAYITGFEITGAGATVGLVVSPTVSGVVGGTLTYSIAAIAGALLMNQPMIVPYFPAIPASAPNTAISVSCPALGIGNTNNTVVAHGYYL